MFKIYNRTVQNKHTVEKFGPVKNNRTAPDKDRTERKLGKKKKSYIYDYSVPRV